jgi:hypothetical protein
MGKNNTTRQAMSKSPPSRAASQLQAVSKALVRERQLDNWRKEIAAGIATLQSQQEHAEREAAEIQAILDADPDLTAVARQMMKTAGELKGSGDEEFSVYNPNYVTSEDKGKLLVKILRDFRRENPSAEAMSFAAIKAVLKSRYRIETASAGLFFRKELKSWETRGGNKNKSVLLASERLV